MVASPRQLPVPDFFDTNNVTNWAYRPNHARIKAEAQKMKKDPELYITPAHLDIVSIHNLIVDGNLDFTMQDGALPVMGRSGTEGMENVINLATFMYKNGWALSDDIITVDRHRRCQIFFTSFWLNRLGLHPRSNIVVLYRDGQLIGVQYDADGKEIVVEWGMQPDPDILSIVAPGKSLPWLYDYCVHYCKTLQEAEDSDPLYLWDEHCLAGEIGAAVHPLLMEAVALHCELRSISPIWAPKGDWFLTENYGPLRPEMLLAHDGSVIATAKQWLYEMLRYGKVLFSGWASSHCVLKAIEQWIKFMLQIDPSGDLLKNGYILEDCMAPVVVRAPDGKIIADFTDKAERAKEKFHKLGLRIVRSTTPIEEWEGMGHLKKAA